MRVGSFIIDAVLLLAIDVAAAVAIVIPTSEYLGPGGPLAEHIDTAEIGLWIGIRWLYYGWWESSRFRATPGAMACHLAVIDAVDGGPLSFSQASIRYFSRYLSVATAGLSWGLIYYHPKRRTVHDMLSGSLAVRFEPETAIHSAIDADPAVAERLENERQQHARREAADKPRRPPATAVPHVSDTARRAAALKTHGRATGRAAPSNRPPGAERPVARIRRPPGD